MVVSFEGAVDYHNEIHEKLKTYKFFFLKKKKNHKKALLFSLWASEFLQKSSSSFFKWPKDDFGEFSAADLVVTHS